MSFKDRINLGIPKPLIGSNSNMLGSEAVSGVQSGDSKNRNVLQYIIAVAVLGAAIGNMFVSRRMKGINSMRWSPFTKRQAEYSKSQSSNQKERINVNDEKFQEKNRQEAREHLREYLDSMSKRSPTYLPPEIQRSLHILDLQIKFPTRDEVKAAYRLKSISYHPDKLPIGTSLEVKKSYEEKFKSMNAAYQTLLSFIEKDEQSPDHK